MSGSVSKNMRDCVNGGARGCEGVTPAHPRGSPESAGERVLIEIKGYYQGTTNVRRLSLLYSLKNRKFIKGYIKGSSSNGDIIYKVYPGRYLRVSYNYWNLADPPKKVEVELIQVREDGSVKTLKEVRIEFYDPEFLNRFPPQLKDLYERRPRYHTKPHLIPLFEKSYNQEENDRLLALLDGPNVVREGEEHE